MCSAHGPQLVSKKLLEEEIFAGTNFRELAFDRENRENFCLAKISRYTVLAFFVHLGRASKNAEVWQLKCKDGVLKCKKQVTYQCLMSY